MVPWRKMVKIRKGAKKGQKGKSARKLGKEVKSINILICSTIPYQMGRKLYSQRLPPRPYYIVHGPTPPWALGHAQKNGARLRKELQKPCFDSIHIMVLCRDSTSTFGEFTMSKWNQYFPVIKGRR